MSIGQGSTNQKLARQYGFRLLGLILFFYILFTADWEKIVGRLADVSGSGIFLVFLLFFPGVSLKVWRWHAMLRLQHIEYPFWRAFFICIYSAGIGFLSPGRLGELSKLFFLKSETGHPVVKTLVAFVGERVMDFFLMILVVFWGTCFFIASFSLLKSLLLTLALSLFLLAVSLLIPLKKYEFWAGSRNRWVQTLGVFAQDANLIFNQRSVLPLVLFTIGAFLFLIWQYVLLARAMALPLGFSQIAFALSLVSLVSILPVSIMGLGTREAALIFSFSFFGLSRDDAISYSLLIFAVQLVANVTILIFSSPFIKMKVESGEGA